MFIEEEDITAKTIHEIYNLILTIILNLNICYLKYYKKTGDPSAQTFLHTLRFFG